MTEWPYTTATDNRKKKLKSSVCITENAYSAIQLVWPGKKRGLGEEIKVK